MKLKIYQVDAFTDKLFSGNPAAVIPLLNDWLDDTIMQKIALENNLAETAFYILKGDLCHIRWFTPEIEVDLCGHATLATGFVLFGYENYPKEIIKFKSKSGILSIRKNRDFLTLDFPADVIQKIELNNELKDCFDIEPVEVYKGKTDYMLVYENEEQIRKIKYDLTKIANVKSRGIIITAPGKKVDFVSRFFAPQSGIIEDPVTGSAHTTLVPYWTKILNKNELAAKQLSKRQGFLKCKYLKNRVEISGKAILYLKGEINI